MGAAARMGELAPVPWLWRKVFRPSHRFVLRVVLTREGLAQMFLCSWLGHSFTIRKMHGTLCSRCRMFRHD